jgi:hypothetical protein
MSAKSSKMSAKSSKMSAKSSKIKTFELLADIGGAISCPA